MPDPSDRLKRDAIPLALDDAASLLHGLPERVRRGRPLNGEEQAPHQRRRLIRAIVESVSSNGFAKSTVSDIASRAKVSRRTFYEQFDSKEEGFLSSYRAADLLLRTTVEGAVADAVGWPERLVAGVTTYIVGMLADPATSLVFLRESWAAGPAAWKLHRLLLRDWADLLRDEVARARSEDVTLLAITAELTPDIALGVVLALEGLALEALESGWVADDLIEPCVSIISGAVELTARTFSLFAIRTAGKQIPGASDLRP